MPFIPAVNTARVQVMMRCHGSLVMNVFHAERAGAWDQATLTTLAQAFISWMNEDVAPFQHNNVQYQTIIARDLTTQEAAGVEIQFPPLSGGDVAVAGDLPNNAALAVKHVTGLTGRSRRGRSFFIGIPEGSQEEDHVTDLYRDAVQVGYTALIDRVADAGAVWVVASFYKGTDPDGEPTPRATAVMTPVISVTVDTTIDSQRRRLAGRGR